MACYQIGSFSMHMYTGSHLRYKSYLNCVVLVDNWQVNTHTEFITVRASTFRQLSDTLYTTITYQTKENENLIWFEQDLKS